jgi:hypothetical protein
MSEKRDNSGTLGANKRKEKDSHPSHTGQANIICPHCGVPAEHWLSAWVKEGPTGKFFSLAYKPKEEQRERVPGKATTRIDLDDEIPF